MGGQPHAPVALPRERDPVSIVQRAVNGCGKCRPPPVIDPLTVQSVVSRYTDYANPAHTYNTVLVMGTRFDVP